MANIAFLAMTIKAVTTFLAMTVIVMFSMSYFDCPPMNVVTVHFDVAEGRAMRDSSLDSRLLETCKPGARRNVH
jgi:hypothetical protein